MTIRIHRSHYRYGVLLVLGFAMLLATLGQPFSRLMPRMPGAEVAQAHSVDFGNLPLSFELNVGQTAPSMHYMVHAAGGTLYFTPSGVTLSLQGKQDDGSDAAGHSGGSGGLGKAGPQGTLDKEPAVSSPAVVSVLFLNTDPSLSMASGATLPGKVNYLLGSDPSKWHTDVATYSGITYAGLCSSIDLQYEGKGGSLKGTFIVAPGADAAGIRWRYEGSDKVWVDGGGNLQLSFPLAERVADQKGIKGTQKGAQAAAPSSTTITEQAPVAWQTIRAFVERESLVEAEKALRTYLDKGAPLGHRGEIEIFLNARHPT